MVSDRQQSREQLLIALLRRVDRYCRMLAAEDGRKRFSIMFSRRSSYARGKRVGVEQGGVGDRKAPLRDWTRPAF